MIRKWRTRLLSALLCASMVVPCASSIGVQAEESSGYRYAVQLYGICVDQVYVSGEGDNVVTETGGLTFGPALGGNYTTKENTDALNQHYKTLSGQTSSGNDHRCIHQDDWTTIIEWNNKDPYVYEDCIDQYCTHAVELTLTEENSAAGTDNTKVYNTAAGNKVIGDGAGSLYYEIQSEAAIITDFSEDGYQDYDPDDEDYGSGEYLESYNRVSVRTYANIRIRAALNGYGYEDPATFDTSKGDDYKNHYSSTNSVLSAFPTELQSAIGRRAVKYAAAYNDYVNVATVYDQLWLFAASELSTANWFGGEGLIPYGRRFPNEGTLYPRIRNHRVEWQENAWKVTGNLKTYNSKSEGERFWLRTTAGDEWGSYNFYTSRWNVYYVDGDWGNEGYGVAPGFVLSTTYGNGASSVAGESHEGCHHSYEWEVYEKATATKDGSMRYRCKYCGDVQYQVPVTAYYTFNKDTQEAILKADANATVKVQTPLFISFHEMVRKALQERPDVTLVVDYKNGDGLYEMTIPAGSGDQLETLFGDSQFAGFLYLGGTYATTQLPEDTVFTNSPAELLWFGTTTAH